MGLSEAVKNALDSILLGEKSLFQLLNPVIEYIDTNITKGNTKETEEVLKQMGYILTYIVETRQVPDFIQQEKAVAQNISRKKKYFTARF